MKLTPSRLAEFEHDGAPCFRGLFIREEVEVLTDAVAARGARGRLT